MKNMKFLTAHFKGRDEEKREITAFASTPTLDRDKEIVLADAWQLDNFKKHPVLLLSHEAGKLWLGKITEITPRPDGLFFRAVFAKTPAAEEAWDLIKSTNIAAFSCCFLPISSETVLVKNLPPAEKAAALRAGMTENNGVRIYTRVELMEISLCSLPSNRESLLLSWKSLARNAELRAALDEIVIEDSPEITIEDSPEIIIEGPIAPSQKALAAEVRELRAKLNEIALTHLAPDEIKGLPAGFRERLKTFRQPDITIAEAEKSVEEFIAEYVRSGDYKKAVDEAVEVAIAKVRGRVI